LKIGYGMSASPESVEEKEVRAHGGCLGARSR
jgi:hypothetical protein